MVEKQGLEVAGHASVARQQRAMNAAATSLPFFFSLTLDLSLCEKPVNNIAHVSASRFLPQLLFMMHCNL